MSGLFDVTTGDIGGSTDASSFAGGTTNFGGNITFAAKEKADFEKLVPAAIIIAAILGAALIMRAKT